MKPNWLDLVIYGFALWRWTHMVVEERGFMDIFLRFRRMVGIVHDDDGHPTMTIDSNLARLFNCVWCSSMFFALFLGVGIYLLRDTMWWLCLPFALSGLAIYLNSRMR